MSIPYGTDGGGKPTVDDADREAEVLVLNQPRRLLGVPVVLVIDDMCNLLRDCPFIHLFMLIDIGLSIKFRNTVIPVDCMRSKLNILLPDWYTRGMVLPAHLIIVVGIEIQYQLGIPWLLVPSKPKPPPTFKHRPQRFHDRLLLSSDIHEFYPSIHGKTPVGVVCLVFQASRSESWNTIILIRWWINSCHCVASR